MSEVDAIGLSCLHRLYFTVVVIPKERLAGLMQAKPSFGMTTTKMFKKPVFYATALMVMKGSH